MHHRGSMTKKEIQQIIKVGWEKRRTKNKTEAKKNSERVKKWKQEEENRRTLEETQRQAIKRFKHYLGEQLNDAEIIKLLEEKRKKS